VDRRLGVRREKDRPALLDIDVLERRDQAATTRATVVMEGNPFAVAVRELRVTLVDDGRAVLVANGFVALAGKRAPHEVEPFGAASHFAAVFEFVAFADGRFHFRKINDFRIAALKIPAPTMDRMILFYHFLN
jgi:hypothetical protein